MPYFKLPLSGDVIQAINPWNWFFKSEGSQFGLVNIKLVQVKRLKAQHGAGNSREATAGQRTTRR